MASKVTKTAAAIAAPALLKRINFSWLAFGAIAYVGLRLMRRYGIFEQPVGRVLDSVDSTVSKGVGYVTDRFQASGKGAENRATI